MQFHWSNLTVAQSESDWIYAWKEYNAKNKQTKNQPKKLEKQTPVSLCKSSKNKTLKQISVSVPRTHNYIQLKTIVS